MTDRTENRKRANEFDRQLLHLMTWADGFGCKDKTHQSHLRDQWARIYGALREVRPMVRAMTHKEDRESTS